MTVSTSTNRWEYDGNGATTAFPYTGKIFAATDLVVHLIGADGNATLQTLNTDYTVSGVGAANGGNVTFTTAPANGVTVLIRRVLPLTQSTSVKNQGAFYPEIHEDAFDRLVMLDQQQQDQIDRSLRRPDTSGDDYDAEGCKIINLADPENEGDAATRGYVDDLVGTIVATGGSTAPTKYEFVGDGVTTDFACPGINVSSPDAYIVTIDGVLQNPGDDYGVDLTSDEIEFSAAPPEDSLVVVRTFGFARIVDDAATLRADLASSTSGKGSELVTFSPAGAGAVARNVQEKLREIVSVKDFGAVGDGVTIVTEAVQAAVDAAVAADARLYWPAGNYNVPSNITNFWSVKHTGPGKIICGATTYNISPAVTETNNLYVATTGADTNTGISALTPFATIQKAFSVLNELADGMLPGRWVINVAAGTYQETVAMDSNLFSEHPVDLVGAAAGHPNVPTTIIDGTLEPSGDGLSVSVGNWLRVTDILIQNFTTGKALENQNARLSLTNVHVKNCKNGCNSLGGNAVTTIRGGLWDGNNIANGVGYIGLFGALHDFKQASADAATDALTISNFARGLLIHEGAQGHLDNVNITDCSTAAVNFKRGCGACNTSGMKLYRNNVGVLVEDNGWFNNSIDFGSGANANTVNVRALGDAPELVYLTVSNSARTMRMLESTVASTHTGTLAETTVYETGEIPAWAISEEGHIARITMAGSSSLAGGACTVRIAADTGSDTALISRDIPSGSTRFKAVVDLYYASDTMVRSCLTIMNNFGESTMTTNITAINSVKNLAHTLKVKLTLSNVGDSVKMEQIIFENTFGG